MSEAAVAMSMPLVHNSVPSTGPMSGDFWRPNSLHHPFPQHLVGARLIPLLYYAATISALTRIVPLATFRRF